MTTAIPGIRTVEERDRLVNVLLTFGRSGFRREDPTFLRELLRLPERLRVALTETLGVPDGVGSETRVAERCDQLEKELSNMRLVRLEVAFEPDDELVDRIIAALRRAAAWQVIADITVFPLLIGGCRISYEGRYKDFSVRRKVVEFFRNAPEPDVVGPGPAS